MTLSAVTIISWFGVVVAAAAILIHGTFFWLVLSLSGLLVSLVGMVQRPKGRALRVPPIAVILLVIGQQLYFSG